MAHYVPASQKRTGKPRKDSRSAMFDMDSTTLLALMAMAVMMLVTMMLVVMHVIASSVALEEEDILGGTVMTSVTVMMPAPMTLAAMPLADSLSLLLLDDGVIHAHVLGSLADLLA